MSARPLPQEAIDQIRALVASGKSQRSVALELGYSKHTVRKYSTPNAQTHFVNEWSPERTARAKAMIDDGVPYAEIARTMGASVKTLEKKFGPSPYRRGELTKFYNDVRLLEGRGSFNPKFGEFRRA